MKFLLLLSLIFWATVSAKTEFYTNEGSTAEKRGAAAPHQVTVYSDLHKYVAEVDFKIKNVFLFSHLFFDSFETTHPILFYDLSEGTFNSSYIFSSLIHSSQSYFSPGYLSRLNLSHSNPIIQKENQEEIINYHDFKYAGSQRFTLSGDPPNLSTHIKPMQASVMGGIAIAAGVALHINQSAAWWDGKGTSFYFYDDWNDALFADKFGHFMGGYFVSYISREALVFSGFSWEHSIFLGSLVGLVVQSYVEFKDGYAENTGFSTSDFVADVAGVTYFYLQHYVPVLQNFSPKWQYTPPDMIGVPPHARTQTFLDNYNSTTAWISVHVRNLFWGEEESLWPKWLNIGFGYGISGYYTSDIFSRFVIGLDYNLVELLPDGFPFWNWLKQSLNGIKFPAPAIEFSNQGTSFRILYPLTISIGSVNL